MDNGPVDTTLYSLSDQPPLPQPEVERRDGERHLTLFRVGAIVVDGRRELCLIKNISAGGMMLRVYCPLQPGQAVEVELKTGQPVRGKVGWVRDSQAGVSFDEPVDVLAILASDDEGPRPRMPRVEVKASAYVRDGANTWRMACSDISQGGIKVATTVALAPDTEVVVTLPGMAPLPAVVRWHAGGQAGISFNSPIALPELVAWLRAQRDAARAA